MSTIAAAIALLGPLLTMEWLISIERRRVLRFPGMSPALLHATCSVLTLWILFCWPIALVLLFTAMATTDRKG